MKFDLKVKISIIFDQGSGIIIGAMNFNGIIHDSKTLPQVLDQDER